jgi:hypothetical protein
VYIVVVLTAARAESDVTAESFDSCIWVGSGASSSSGTSIGASSSCGSTSAGAPNAATTPLRMRTTLSQRAAQWSACVTSTTARSLRKPRMHFSKSTRPTLASSALSGSSSSTSGARLYAARATDTRCFWPPDRPAPRSPSTVRSPLSIICRSVSMQHDLDHLGVALGVKLAAEQNVVADRAGKEPRVLLRERALHAGTLGHRAAAQVQAAQQRQHQRRLAAAGRADDGEHLAALAAQRDAAQRGGGARRHARIGEGGVLELEEHARFLGSATTRLQVVDVDAEEVLLDAAQADEAAREVDGDLRRREQRIAEHVEERNDAECDGGGEHARIERVVHRKRDRGNDDGHGEDERVGGGADARALDEAELGGGAEALNARGKVVLPGVVLGELDGGEKLGRRRRRGAWRWRQCASWR